MKLLFKLGTLKIRLIVIGVLLVVGFLTVFLIGVFQGFIGDGDDDGGSGEGEVIESGDEELSEEVEGYRNDVKKEAKKNDIEDHTDVLLALMMQESGGKGKDVFQASESKCGSIGCIDDTDESIKQGVKYYAKQLDEAEGDIKLALQSYNFGGGFIDYALDENDGYSKKVAVNFSSKKYDDVKGDGNYSCINPEYEDEGACYGDVEYVDNVLQYYHAETADKIESIKEYDDDNDGGGNGEWNKPIKGNPDINDPYGERDNPTGSGDEFHKGIDFACTGGSTPIIASEDGKVIFSEFNDGGFGNTVMVKHGDKYSHYAHMSDRKVEKGDKVKQGDKVGVCGSTGNSTGPHLHFEAKKGSTDPADLFDGQFDPEKMLK